MALSLSFSLPALTLALFGIGRLCRHPPMPARDGRKQSPHQPTTWRWSHTDKWAAASSDRCSHRTAVHRVNKHAADEKGHAPITFSMMTTAPRKLARTQQRSKQRTHGIKKGQKPLTMDKRRKYHSRKKNSGQLNYQEEKYLGMKGGTIGVNFTTTDQRKLRIFTVSIYRPIWQQKLSSLNYAHVIWQCGHITWKNTLKDIGLCLPSISTAQCIHDSIGTTHCCQ